MENSFGPDYASLKDTGFVAKYQASCFCGTVRYEVNADPVDAKICHCTTCQRLHGPLCSGQRFSTNAILDSLLVWRIWFFITVNKTGQSAFSPVRFAAANVVPPLPMRGAGCGSLFHHCLISGIKPRYRKHSGQPVIFSMVQSGHRSPG